MKKINIKKIILLSSIIILISIICRECIASKENYIDEELIKQKQIEEIVSSRKKSKEEIKIYYEDISIPYNKERNYYLLNDSKNDYKKINCKSDFEIEIVKKDANKIDILIYNKEYYKYTSIEYTNIPVMTIKTNSNKNDKSYGEMYLYDSDKIHYNCEYHVRGGSSSLSEKKSYKLNIKNNKNKKTSIAMLGMKKDSDWVLNPLYSDSSYIREKIGLDIWNTLSDEYNHTAEYIELIIDGKYQGIYCLQEVIDLDTFDANKNKDMLVSIKKWNYDIEERNLYNDKYSKENIVDEFEYEKGIRRIDLLRGLVDKVRGQSVENVEYDLRNNANYSVFINLIMGIDNTYKNEKILFRESNGKYIVQKTPWDIDFSLVNENIMSQFDIKEILIDYTLSWDFIKNEEFKKNQKQQYFEIRKNLYNEEKLNNCIDNYIKYLTKSGAIEREKEKWETINFEESIQNIRNFFKERIKILDSYYGGL